MTINAILYPIIVLFDIFAIGILIGQSTKDKPFLPFIFIIFGWIIWIIAHFV